MKKILILSLLTGLILAGCMSDNIVNPVSQNDQFKGFQWLTNTENSLTTETELIVSRQINGNFGGKMFFDEAVGRISIEGSLYIPAGSFPGNQTVSVTFNDARFYQEYYPSPYTFRTPLILNLTYRNVDFSTSGGSINFFYIDDNGNIYRGEYDALIVDQTNKTLGVVNARLPHFSRWGWAKTAQ